MSEYIGFNVITLHSPVPLKAGIRGRGCGDSGGDRGGPLSAGEEEAAAGEEEAGEERAAGSHGPEHDHHCC